MSANHDFIQAPDYHNCTNVTVPNNLYCYEDPTSGHTLECPRSCPMDCIDAETDTVCASDLGTYDGSCNLSKKVYIYLHKVYGKHRFSVQYYHY